MQVAAHTAALRDRLRGIGANPLLMGPGAADVFTGEPGDHLDPSSGVVRALRRAAQAIVEVQREIVEAGADLVVAPTAATTAPSLQSTGQSYRAAALTAAAVDLTRDAVLASRRNSAVLGEIDAFAGARARAESRLHVERLATYEIDGILVHAIDPAASREVVDIAAGHGIPTLLEIDHTEAATLVDASWSSLVIVAGPDGESIARALGLLTPRFPGLPFGARIVRNETDPLLVQTVIAAAWAALSALRLSVIGVGGRAGLSALHALRDLSRNGESVPSDLGP
jgi:hypothetical protein